MKECVLRNWALVCVMVMISFAGSPARAQNDPSGTVPTNAAVITISASDPAAAEGLPANNGVFTVRRSGNTNTDVLVFYRLSGTASNGVDYQLLPGTVSLPADDALKDGSDMAMAVLAVRPGFRLHLIDGLFKAAQPVAAGVVPQGGQDHRGSE